MDKLLKGLEQYAYVEKSEQEFGARVFKISRDEQGNRLTWLRVTGGVLKVKDLLDGTSDGEGWQEKVNPVSYTHQMCIRDSSYNSSVLPYLLYFTCCVLLKRNFRPFGHKRFPSASRCV